MEKQTVRRSIKIKKSNPTVMQSFKLIDFNIYDENTKSVESDSGSDNEPKYYPRTDEKAFIIQAFGINEKGANFIFLHLNNLFLKSFFFIFDVIKTISIFCFRKKFIKFTKTFSPPPLSNDG